LKDKKRNIYISHTGKNPLMKREFPMHDKPPRKPPIMSEAERGAHRTEQKKLEIKKNLMSNIRNVFPYWISLVERVCLYFATFFY